MTYLYARPPFGQKFAYIESERARAVFSTTLTDRGVRATCPPDSEMVPVSVAIVLLAFCAGTAKSFPAMEAAPAERVFRGGLASDGVDEVYDSYYAVSVSV